MTGYISICELVLFSLQKYILRLFLVSLGVGALLSLTVQLSNLQPPKENE